MQEKKENIRNSREKRIKKRIIQKKKRRNRRRAIIVLICLLGILSIAQGMIKKSIEDGDKNQKGIKTEQNEPAKGKEAKAVINTAGDIIMHKPFLTSSVYTSGNGYDYNSIFKYVKKYYESGDFAVTTNEFAMTGSDYSGYPLFNAPKAIGKALKENGVDMCLLANNHIYDKGDEGLQKTIDSYKEEKLLYTGVRKKEKEKKYVVKEINGIKIGFFNYVFETQEVGGTKAINGIAINKQSENLINTFKEDKPKPFYKDVEKILKEMKKEGAEYTIGYIHWGVEYQTKENSKQDAIAQHLCDMGIDAIIGSHPHVIEPVDLLTSSNGKHKTICCYAIGNHLSNQRTEYMEGLTNGYSEDGMMVSLTINRDDKGNISLEKAEFIPTWVYHDKKPDDRYYILPLDKPNEIEEKTGLSGIKGDIESSLKRTNSIIGSGVKKVKENLPIKN